MARFSTNYHELARDWAGWCSLEHIGWQPVPVETGEARSKVLFSCFMGALSCMLKCGRAFQVCAQPKMPRRRDADKSDRVGRAPRDRTTRGYIKNVLISVIGFRGRRQIQIPIHNGLFLIFIMPSFSQSSDGNLEYIFNKTTIILNYFCNRRLKV